MEGLYQKFKDWISLKFYISTKHNNILFKEGDIWWCSLGMNVGEEVYGKGLLFARPVLVFKKFTANTFLALPLTTEEKYGSWYVEIASFGAKRRGILNQIRILDKKRLIKRIGAVTDADFLNTKQKFIDFYSS